MRPDLSPTARALLALELLRSSPVVPASRLADRLGVTTRAVRRYVEILREADLPVESVRGPGGGYRLGRGVRLPPLVFDDAEALGLVMAVLDGHHDAGDTTGPVGSALGKLLGALPASTAAHADAVRRAISAAPDRGAVRPDPAITVALVEAGGARRRVRLRYRSEAAERAGTDRELDVEPWSVVVRHGRWYLLCRSTSADAVRAYRVDRVHGVEVLAATFVPPSDLDPVTLLEEHLAVGWAHGTEVLVAAPLDRLRYLPRVLGRLERVDDATTRIVGSTDNPTWYAEQLAGVPAPFTVVGGPELRAAVHALAGRLAAATA